jgi:Xaa-Pro aminopeptidase
MVVSNEPGYYKEGAYGIRHENLVLVRDVEIGGAEQPMLGFETLTLAPFDRRGLAPELMSAADRAWLDGYHARVLAEIGPLLEDDTERAWLKAACAPL